MLTIERSSKKASAGKKCLAQREAEHLCTYVDASQLSCKKASVCADVIPMGL